MIPGLLRATLDRGFEARQKAVEPIRIQINTAPWGHWLLLEGIGPARARAIVADRDARGPFRSVEDLARVPNMPSGWVERARGQLACEAP